MNDDELRAKLTKALDDHRIVSFSRDGVRCECADDTPFALMQWEQHRRHVADALLPVVRKALAQAWDHGHRTANPVIPDTHRDVINPWKQP